MAAASDEDTVDYIFQRKYSPRQVADMTQRDHVRYAMVEKPDGFTGDSHSYAMTYGTPQGVGADFATALAASSAAKGKKLRMLCREKYGFITLKGTAMAKARRQGDGAFLEFVSLHSDGIFTTMGNDIAFDLYRTGNGKRGQIASHSGNIIQLSNVADALYFDEDMTLVGDDTEAGTSARAGSCTVTKVDEDLGQITVSTFASANLVDGDYLFRSADVGGSTCVDGLGTLIPLVAPSPGENFRDIDRTANLRKLAGVRISDYTETLENNVGLAMVKMRTSSNDKSRIKFYANPLDVYDVVRRGNGKVCYDDAGGTLTWGFERCEVQTPYGTVPILADPDCPLGLAYGCSEADEYLLTLGEVVHVLRDDGMKVVRLGTSDGIRMDVRSLGNYAITRPGAFAVIKTRA